MGEVPVRAAPKKIILELDADHVVWAIRKGWAYPYT